MVSSAMALTVVVLTAGRFRLKGKRSRALVTASAFELVLGGDALPAKKPDPMPMLHAARALGAAPAEVVAIGDSVNDALAARAAGMAVFAVPYGYNEGRDVGTLDVDGIVGSLLEAARRIDVIRDPS
ncbi:MAG: HAD-IA family hydrolase, partial [Burkholderiales bacterium]